MKQQDNIIYKRTPMGEDLLPFLKLFDRLEKTKSEKMILDIETEILLLNVTFRKKWNKDALDLIVRAFGDETERGRNEPKNERKNK